MKKTMLVYVAIALIFVFLTVSFSGCMSEKGVNICDISWLDQGYAKTAWESPAWDNSMVFVSEGNYHYHDRLQKNVSLIEVGYPLDTYEQVAQYAQELYTILVKLDLMSADFSAVYVDCWNDGVIQICFYERPFTYEENGVIVGSFQHGGGLALISAVDGHVIYYRCDE